MTEKKEERVRDRVRYICCAAGVVLTCLVTGCGKTEENLDIAMQKIQELESSLLEEQRRQTRLAKSASSRRLYKPEHRL